MKGLENETYLYMLVASVAIASFMVLVAFKWPKAARWVFFLLFAWASCINFYTSQTTPLAYLNYANLAWIEWYRIFIIGWFADHVSLAVGAIAACQGLIAISMLFKGWLFKIGAWAPLFSC